MPAIATGEDWYSFDVADPTSSLRLRTSTPADGANQFSNALNPHLELFDSSDTFLASGVALADGRNEVITYQPPAAGTYKVRVTQQGTTGGEYILAKSLSSVVSGLALTTPEDVPLPVIPAAADAENDPLTFSFPDGPQHGSVSVAGATVTYTPEMDYFGADSFTYKANDGSLDSNVAMVTVSVTSVNDPPSFTKGGNQSFGDGSGAHAIANWATNLMPGPVTATDEVGQALDFIVTNSNNRLFSAQPQVLADGTLKYTIQPNTRGTATVTVSLHDSGGGNDTSAPQKFAIEVTKDHPWYNSVKPLDVDNNGSVEPLDALNVINYLNAKFPTAIPPSAPIGGGPGYLDTNANDEVAPLDALLVVNALIAGQGEGEGQESGIGGRESGVGGEEPAQDLLALLAVDAAEAESARRKKA